MTVPSKPRLIVNADDVGLCRAVTDGALLGVERGAVTQVSVMPPAPDAERAVDLLRAAGVPAGVHLTLACEWVQWRWSSLTRAASLGGLAPLPEHVRDLDGVADPEQVVQELRAQVGWAVERGLKPQHLDAHVAPFDPVLTARVSAESGLPSRDPVPPPGRTVPLDSIWHLSLRPYHTKADDLRQHVCSLGPGTHMVVCHPALDRPELTRLSTPDSRRWKWARDIRVSDLNALLAVDLPAWCDAHGVELTTVGMAQAAAE